LVERWRAWRRRGFTSEVYPKTLEVTNLTIGNLRFPQTGRNLRITLDEVSVDDVDTLWGRQ
jgi:hypothetical protein